MADDKSEATIGDEEDCEKEKEETLLLVKELKEKLNKKAEARKINQNVTRPDEHFFKKLDTTLKKNTAFVKKLGKITEQQRTSLSNEFQSLNLTRYIQEVVSTLLEAKLRMSDIPCAVHMCSLMHGRYADFTPQLFQASKRLTQARIDDKLNFVSSAGKLRTDLRFISELTIAGILSDKEGLTLVHNLLCALSALDHERHDLLSVVISLCKHNGEDLAGLVPKKNRVLADKYGLELPKSDVFTKEKQKIFYSTLLDYWNSAKDHLIAVHKDLQATDRRNRQILQNKGELHEERSREYADKHVAYQKLLLNCNTLAGLMDVDTPDLPETEQDLGEGEIGMSIFGPTSTSATELVDEVSIWEDEDQRSFYTNLLDLKAIIPAILFKDSSKSNKSEAQSKSKTKFKQNTSVKPVGPKPAGKGDLAAEDMDADILDLDVGELDSSVLDAVQEAADARANLGIKSEDSEEEKDVASLEEESEEEETVSGTNMKVVLENYLVSLKNCVNRDLIDKAAQEFCMSMNTRTNRKRLARALFNVHRSRLDLIPFYARLAATLHPCNSTTAVSDHLSAMLLRDFRFHVRKKDQIHIESKVKTVRFIGEMCKFGMISHTDTLNCLKVLVLEFSPHAIEMACALLETSGRFLLRLPTSHLRARVLLEQLVRKKNAKVLDQRYSTMIDNAKYSCDPPKIESVVYKPRPVMHQYIRKLLFRDLSKSSVEKVLRQMRKLPWNDPDINSYIIKCLSQSWSIKFNNVHCLSSLIAGLVNYRDDVGHNVVDDVLEEIRIGMEINHPRYNQRRVSSVKFLGELYNYRMLESTVIFNILYCFITFGVSYDPDHPTDLDHPEQLFRIRLVCVLLETCGQYFDRGSSKKKLDYFLAYFQRYIWFKKSLSCWSGPPGPDGEATSRFPTEIDYLVQDTIEPLRPKLSLTSSFEESIAAVGQVEKEIFAKLAKVVPQADIHGLGKMPENDPTKGLASIPEDPPISSEIGYSSQSENESDDDVNNNTTLEHHQEEDADYGGNGDEIFSTPRHFPSEEDDHFQKQFDSILAESIQARQQTQVVQQDMTVPVNVRKSIQLEQSKQQDESIKFVLLTKKGNKPTLKPLRIPVTEQVAAGLRNRSQAEERRKQEMKQITLSINERQVEEEQHQIDASYSRAPPANMNRERRNKYQPPKGAPNADLIFSSGGRRK